MKKYLSNRAVIVPLAVLSLLLLSCPLAQAQINPSNLPGENDPNLIFNVIDKIMNWAFYILTIVAGLMIIYAAFLYLTSGGDEAKVKSAKNYILYAVVAIIVAFLAKGIVALVKNILTTS